MPVVVAIAVALVVGATFPRAANVAAYLITLGFLLPFFTLGGGVLAWSVATLTGHDVALGSCLLTVGLPMGLGITWFVLSE